MAMIPTFDKDMMVTFLTQDAEEASNSFRLGEKMKEAALQIKYYADKWSTDREQLELEWQDCWAQYFSNYRAANHLRNSALSTSGNELATKWRHQVTTGKGFELVETVNSYLQSAFFPNKTWFDLYPKQYMDTPEWEEVLQVVQKYLLYKFDESRFEDYWDAYVRQLLVVGTSVLALPWRYDAITTYKNQKVTKKGKTEFVPAETLKVLKNGFDFKVVDMFDFYIDPNSTEPGQGNCIRRIVKRRGEVVRLIEMGVYPMLKKEDLKNAESYAPSNMSSTHREEMKWMTGLDSEYVHNNELVALYEFWGDLQIGDVEFCDICATVVGTKLASFMPNPYWGGRPFIVGTFTNTHDSPYGTSLLQPVLGQLQKMFEVQNHRLDVDELTINPVMLVVNDGSIDMGNLYVEPGKIIPVEDVESSVQPLQLPNTTQVAVQDEQILESRIDKITGVGAYVGVNSGRQAERVTAEEIQAQRDAGGNRLGRYHKHIESTCLKEFLTKSYAYMQQFVISDEVVRLRKEVKGSFKEQYDYVYVGQEELQFDLDICPVGSDHIIDKEYELRQRIDFYSFISQYPELVKFINWQEAIKDLSRRFLKGDWEKFLKIPDEEMAPGEGAMEGEQQMAPPGGQPPMSPEEQAMMEQMMAQQQPPPTGNADANAYIDQLAANPDQTTQLVGQAVENNKWQNLP